MVQEQCVFSVDACFLGIHCLYLLVMSLCSQILCRCGAALVFQSAFQVCIYSCRENCVLGITSRSAMLTKPFATDELVSMPTTATLAAE